MWAAVRHPRHTAVRVYRHIGGVFLVAAGALATGWLPMSAGARLAPRCFGRTPHAKAAETAARTEHRLNRHSVRTLIDSGGARSEY